MSDDDRSSAESSVHKDNGDARNEKKTDGEVNNTEEKPTNDKNSREGSYYSRGSDHNRRRSKSSSD